MSIEAKECIICTTGFRPKSLNDEKCDLCNKLYPKERSMDEVMRKKKPDPHQVEQDRAYNERIIKVIDNRLHELGVLKECTCGSFYYKSSPAKKSCGLCDGNSEEN